MLHQKKEAATLLLPSGASSKQAALMDQPIIAVSEALREKANIVSLCSIIWE